MRRLGSALTQADGPSVIVEFAGLPGSGKSTLAHALAQALRRSGARVSEPTYDITHRGSAWRRRRLKLGLLAHALLAHPWRSLSAVLEIRRSGQASLRDSWSATSNLLYQCGLLHRLAARPGAHVLDQGLVNALWSVGFSARACRPLARLGEIAGACVPPVARIVIFVETRPETITGRLFERVRVQSRLEQRLGGAGGPAALESAVAALQQTRSAVEALRRASWRGIEVLVVPGEGVTSEFQASELAEVVRSRALPSSAAVSGTPGRRGGAGTPGHR